MTSVAKLAALRGAEPPQAILVPTHVTSVKHIRGSMEDVKITHSWGDPRELLFKNGKLVSFVNYRKGDVSIGYCIAIAVESFSKAFSAAENAAEKIAVNYVSSQIVEPGEMNEYRVNNFNHHSTNNWLVVVHWKKCTKVLSD